MIDFNKVKVGDKVRVLFDRYDEGNTTSTIKRAEKAFSHGVTLEDGYFYLLEDLELITDNMKIIGYKLIKDTPTAKANITLKFNASANYWEGQGKYGTVQAPIEAVKDVEWFEPIYEKVEVTVKLSNGRIATLKDNNNADITYDGNVASIRANDVTFTLKALNKLGQIAGYNVAIKEFQLGCQSFTISDLQAVDKAFRDFK